MKNDWLQVKKKRHEIISCKPLILSFMNVVSRQWVDQSLSLQRKHRPTATVDPKGLGDPLSPSQYVQTHTLKHTLTDDR